MNGVVTAFAERHGDYVTDAKPNQFGQWRPATWVYHHNGATRDINPLGALCEPPTDEIELARNIRTYWYYKTLNAEYVFNKNKAEYLQLPGAAFLTDEPVKELEKLQKKVIRLRKCLHAADEKLDVLTGKSSAEASAACKQADSDIIKNKIMAVKI